MNETTTALATRSDFDAAVARARAAARDYYDGTATVMVDADYDALTDAIEAALTLHPEWDDQGVTTQVAAGAATSGDVLHPQPMLSLDKAKTLDGVARLLDLADAPVTVEAKMDGVAVRVEYRDGALTLAATRGDGIHGEDITANVLRGVSGLPATLPSAWNGEVRGEIYMTNADFEAASAERVRAGKGAFINSRNAVAGSLRNIDREYEAPMSFAAYSATGDDLDGMDRHDEQMAYLNDTLTITTVGALTRHILAPVYTDSTDVLHAVGQIEKHRTHFDFPIDGAVIKVASHAARTRLGMGTRAPRWAVAYKYAPDTATSVLRDVIVAVGRTGRLSYTAVIDPTFVGGTTVTRASLHNAPWIINEGLGIGSVVSVYRAGDVIPRVTAPVGEQPADVTPYQPADTCPQCGETVDKSSLLWRCHTPSCSTVGRITYAASRDCLDIDGLGEEVATALVESGAVSTVADLFDLTVEQVAATRLGANRSGSPRVIGLATAAKIVAGIEHAKTQPFNRVITSLGIRMTGRSVGRWLANEFGSMDALRAASVERVAQVDRLGTVKARHIVEGLAAMGEVIDRLAAHGVTMEVAAASSQGDGAALPFAGKKVVVSGSVPGLNRTEAQEAAAALGATVSGSVSRNTDLLVAGEGAGSKLAKAESLGVAVMDASEFAALVAATAR